MTAAAELEIRNVLARLAHLADRGDVDGYVALMTDDVVWDMPANPAIGLAGSRGQGHAEIAAGVHERLAAGVQGPGSNTMHIVTTTAVEIGDDGDTATALSHFVYLGQTAAAPTIISAGRYQDVFRQTEGGWKLAYRSIAFG